MSYIPPHKRHLKSDGNGSGSGTSSTTPPPSPVPIPESLVPQFNRSLNFKTSLSKKKRDKKIVYANAAISKWFSVGLAYDDDDDDDHSLFVSLTNLESFSSDFYQYKSREIPLTLVLNHDRLKGSFCKPLIMLTLIFLFLFPLSQFLYLPAFLFFPLFQIILKKERCFLKTHGHLLLNM